ncbi:class I SAM-dependent methyltransferase [Methylovirgula sp. 4M-Z18]|uniref:class I SAM-dependent methyltransferase n=1 Tax=Methylovirgula sp. 4M-Z18 TaxID=2293567 RepID=UPI0026D8E197
MTANHHLKEEIRDYWSKRSETFDLAFGHRIPPGPEFDAWQKPIRNVLGRTPRRFLELACGTGEVTRLIHDLGHHVTALDFSEHMLAVARRKHTGKARLRFLLADAERPMEPLGSYDAIVCRHLVWTLTEPEKAFAEWHALLKPGGKLLVFDGDWATPTRRGGLAARLIALLDRWYGPDTHYDSALGSRHAQIMANLPFGSGLTQERLMPLLRQAGFTNFTILSHAPIAAAQRRNANLRDRLRTLVYRRFILCAQKAANV